MRAIWGPGRGFAFETEFFGMRYRGDTAQLLDWHVFGYGAYALNELTLLADLAAELRRSGKKVIFFDIGANLGQHSLFMSQRADKVIAFEPFPALRMKMAEKLTANRVSNVSVVPYALGDASQRMLYYPGGGGNSGAGTFIPEPGYVYDAPVEIDIRAGDELFDELRLQPITLMKMDIEGMEPAAIRGLARRIASDRPVIVMETFERCKAGFGSEDAFRSSFWEGAVFAEVSGRSGHVYRLRPFDWKNSGEALVVPPELAGFVNSRMDAN